METRFANGEGDVYRYWRTGSGGRQDQELVLQMSVAPASNQWAYILFPNLHMRHATNGSLRKCVCQMGGTKLHDML